MMRLGSYFLGGRAFVFQAELYVGLLMFISYVLFDTQVVFAASLHLLWFQHLHVRRVCVLCVLALYQSLQVRQ